MKKHRGNFRLLSLKFLLFMLITTIIASSLIGCVQDIDNVQSTSEITSPNSLVGSSNDTEWSTFDNIYMSFEFPSDFTVYVGSVEGGEGMEIYSGEHPISHYGEIPFMVFYFSDLPRPMDDDGYFTENPPLDPMNEPDYSIEDYLNEYSYLEPSDILAFEKVTVGGNAAIYIKQKSYLDAGDNYSDTSTGVELINFYYYIQTDEIFNYKVVPLHRRRTLSFCYPIEKEQEYEKIVEYIIESFEFKKLSTENGLLNYTIK